MSNHKIIPVIIEVKPTKNTYGGVGLFAVANLAIGTVIATSKQYDADFYTWSEYDSLSEATKYKIDHFCLSTGRGFYVPKNLNDLSIAWYMNHSCDPNVAFNDTGDFVTIKPAKNDDELCWDYGYGETYPKFKMECLCGSPKCRKIITGNDWKNSEFRTKYSKYFLPELRDPK